MSFHAQLTPDMYYILPFLLVGKVEDENNKPLGWMVQCGWLGIEITWMKDEEEL